MHRRDNKYVTNFSRNLKGRNNFEGLGIDARLIQKSVLKKTVWEDVRWTNFIQDRAQCWVVVNTGRNLGFHKRWRLSALAGQMLRV